jgi:hypothetical protein
VITIIINKDEVKVDTENKANNTTGCTLEERQLLLSVAQALCDNCKEGAE